MTSAFVKKTTKNGTPYLLPYGADARKELAGVADDAIVMATIAEPRSWEQLKRYQAMIGEVFEHWPEYHQTTGELVPQYPTREALRKSLQMAAGAKEAGAVVDLAGMNKAQALLIAEAAIRGSGAYAEPVIEKGVLTVWRPLSIALANMPHKKFCRLSNDVAEVIMAMTGINPETLMRNSNE